MRRGGRTSVIILFGALACAMAAISERNRVPADCRTLLAGYTQAAIQDARRHDAASAELLARAGTDYLGDGCRAGMLLDIKLGVDEAEHVTTEAPAP